MPVKITKQYGRELKEHNLYTKEELNSMFGGNIIQAGESVGRVVELSDKFDQLDVNIDQSIIDAFDQAGFYYDNQINQINDFISDALDGKVEFDTEYNQVVINEQNGITVTGFNGTLPVSRVNLRGSGTTNDGLNIGGIVIQKFSTPNWITNFWLDNTGNIYMNGNLQMAEGSILVGTRNNPVVFISQEQAFQGVTVTGSSSRTIIGEGQDDEQTLFAGIAIQELVGSNWISNFYADAQGNVFLRGEINATSGFLGSLTIGGVLDSDNYITGEEGFRIDGGTGNAEFNRVTVRNPNEDYILDENGIRFSPGTSYADETGLTWESQLYGDFSLHGRSGAGGKFIRANADVVELAHYSPALSNTAFEVDARSGFELIRCNIMFRFPRYTTTQRNNLPSPSAGVVIYNTTESRPQFHNGNSWNNF